MLSGVELQNVKLQNSIVNLPGDCVSNGHAGQVEAGGEVVVVGRSGAGQVGHGV